MQMILALKDGCQTIELSITKKDVIVLISSGRSQNILNAAKIANKKN